MAAAILGLASGVLLWASSESQSTLERAAHRRQAAIFAATILEEYQLDLAEERGTEEGNPPWRWQVAAKNTSRGQELTVTVTWPEERGQGSYTLTTLARIKP